MKNKCSNKIALSSNTIIYYRKHSQHTYIHANIERCEVRPTNKKNMVWKRRTRERKKTHRRESWISFQYWRFIFIRLAFFRYARWIYCCCFRSRRCRSFLCVRSGIFISKCIYSWTWLLLFRFLLSFSILCYDPLCISKWNESEKWSDKNFHRITRNRWISLKN